MSKPDDRLLRDACTRHLSCKILNCGKSSYDLPFTREERRVAFIVVSYLDQGDCTISIDDQTHHCKQGSMAVISEFRKHTYLAKGTKTQTQLKESWMYLRLRIFGTVDLCQLLDIPPIIGAKNNDALRRCLNKIIKIASQGDQQSIDHALQQQSLMRDFLRHLLHIAPLKLSDERLQALMRILPAVEYIQQHFREDYKRDELAQRTGLANSRFHELFKKALYFSPVVYRNHLRLQEAKRLLSASHDSVQDIAQHVGFVDPFNFSRLFKSTYGMSPRAWRQNGVNETY